MTQEYVVDVSAPAPGEADAVAGQLARILKLDETRVTALVRRLPDVVTRPVTFDEATAVVDRFSRAGLRARIRKVSRESAPTLFDTLATRPSLEQDQASATEETFHDDDLFLDTGAAAPAPDPDLIPETEPAESEAFEELTPAELQARLRGDRTTPQVQEAAAADAPPAAPAPAAAPSQPTLETSGPAAAPAGAATGPARSRRRGSLQSKMLSTAIIPVLLTIIGALAATWFTARPALYDQLLESARNPAIATAASLSSAFEQTAAGTGIDYLQLQSTILITRQAFPRDDIAFIIATDQLGNPLPGFFAGAESLTADAADLQNAIRDRAVEAIELGTDARAGSVGTSSQLIGAATGIEIVAQPLIVSDEAVGAVVVGVSDAAVTAQVTRIIINVLLFSLIPLLIAIVIAVRRARRLTGGVLELTNKADEISRGELEEQVEFRSNDELDDLAAALERMRVSMRGALERLRRRR